MQKGSLVQLKPNKRFTMTQIYKAYELGILLPRPGEIYTLSENPILGTCTCGNNDCPNSATLRFEETEGEYGMGMFEEVQAPEVVNITELFNSSH